jgi:hypothetical protein
MPPDGPDWLTAAKGAVRRARLGARAEHRGRVEEIGDGVAMISGLRDVRLDEVLRFEGGQFGFARVLDPDLIGCVFVDAATRVESGDAVFGTGEVVSVPVGESLLGRIVDPLGRPLGRKGGNRGRGPVADRAPGALDHRTRSRDTACADRDPRDGHAVRAWTGPARVDRRRPFHRQDDAGHRRDDRAGAHRHDLRLCRRGAKDIERAPRHRRAAGAWQFRALHR